MQYLIYIKSIIAILRKTIELEYQRRIQAIDKGAIYYKMKESHLIHQIIPAC
jgi:hypothetical protein